MNGGKRVYAGFGRERAPLIVQSLIDPQPEFTTSQDSDPQLAVIESPPRLRTRRSRKPRLDAPPEEIVSGSTKSPQGSFESDSVDLPIAKDISSEPFVVSLPTEDPFEHDRFLLDNPATSDINTSSKTEDSEEAVSSTGTQEVKIPQEEPENILPTDNTPETQHTESKSMPIEGLPQEEKTLEVRERPRFVLPRWSVHAQWRILSDHPDALDSSKEFVPGEKKPDANGLYEMHEYVQDALHAHLQDIQKNEWRGVRVPKGESISKGEKRKAELWKENKNEFANLLGVTIVPDASPRTESLLPVLSETFAYKLYLWMEAGIKSISRLYNENPNKRVDIEQALAYIGISPLDTTKTEKTQKNKLTQEFWHVYQSFFSEGINSPVTFANHIALAIRTDTSHGSELEKLHNTMDVVRKLPLFGKQGDLMNAIELATSAIMQTQDVYQKTPQVSWLDPQSKDAQVISFIQQKASAFRDRLLPTGRSSFTRRAIKPIFNTSEDDISVLSHL